MSINERKKLNLSKMNTFKINLKDVKTNIDDRKMFTNIKSLIAERSSQMLSQRRKMLNRLKGKGKGILRKR